MAIKQRLQKLIKEYIKKYKNLNKWYKCFLILASIVVFATTYALILPGITLEDDEHIYWVKLNDASEITTSGVYMFANPAETYSLTFNNTSLSKAAITVTQKGTKDNRTYYDITGAGAADTCMWQFETDGNGWIIKNYGNTAKYLKVTNYTSHTDIVLTQNDATNNGVVEKQTNNLWHIFRESQNGQNKNYYISYINDAFSIENNDNNDANLNIYMQIIVKDEEEEPDDPTTPTVKKTYWQRVESTNEILNTDIYMIVNEANNQALTYNGTAFSQGAITVTQKGTKDNKAYYEISGDGATTAHQWKFGTNTTIGTIYNNADNTKYIRLSNNQVITDQANANTNITIASSTNNTWQISRSGSYNTYYIVYNNNTFARNTSTTGSNLILYRQVTIEEEVPVTPPTPTTETYWVKLENTNELTTDDVYMFVDASNTASITYSDSTTSFVSGSVIVNEAGTTSDNKKYYSISGDGSSENSQWKITTNSTVNTIYNKSNNDIFIRISTYNATTNFVNQTTSSTNNSTNNLAILDAGNGLWYLTRISSQSSASTYYVNYSNNTFAVASGNTANAALNVYRQIEIITEPDEPDEPKEEKWILVTDAKDIKAGDTYIVGYYKDDQYTEYNSHYMGVDSSNNIIRGEIAFEEIENDGEYTYYKTNDATDSFRWIFSTDTTGGTLKNVSDNLYLNFNQGTLSMSQTGTNTIMEWNTANYWLIHSTISGQDYYLKFNNANNTYQFNAATGENYRALKIYKLVVEEEPDEPDDPDTPIIPIEEDISGDAADSGKLITDKTVEYNNNNTFTISLSTLGQDYDLTNELGINENLLDVVFVVDNSQVAYTTSNTNETLNANNASSHARTYVTAINSMITQINSLNPHNRIAVVSFNSSVSTLLPLDSYTSSDNTYLSATASFSRRGAYNSASMSVSNTVRNSSNNTVSNTHNAANTKYTQLGVSTGAKILTNATTTRTYNYTYQYNDGTTEQITKTVQRRPMIILLTDGYPTVGTTTYNNPPTNVTSASNSDPYNLVRTSKYFKDQIETHYYGSIGSTYNTYYYTIFTPGTVGDNNLIRMYTAMLTPNSTNITNLSTTSGQNGYNFRTAMTSDSNYTNNNNYYLYNTDSYYSTSFTANGLAQKFNDWLPENKEHDFGFKLKDNLIITDYIGEGMEIKGEPSLIYNNVTYTPSSYNTNGNTKTYHYTGTYTNSNVPGLSINLNTITAEVITENNMQTVRFIIPEGALPLYHTNLKVSELPAKLKFNVGLNSTAQEEVDYQDHGELTYYTNKWDNVTAHADYVTTKTNPYFSKIKSDLTKGKITPTDNLLTTANYSWRLPANNLNIQYLGNNGKLTYIVDSINVDVNGIWNNSNPNGDLILKAYVKSDTSVAPLLDKRGNQYSITLTEDNNYSGTVYYLPVPNENQTYYFVQTRKEGYATKYDNGENILINSEYVKSGKVTINDHLGTITVTNSAGTELPPTGSSSELIIYILGSLILLGSIMLILKNKIRINN